MVIRPARSEDSPAIRRLLQALDYEVEPELLDHRLRTMMGDDRERILIAEVDGIVVGFVSIHFIPQLPFAGDFARISYLCVEEKSRARGIGRQLEECCVAEARARNCHRIELHCHARRTGAHLFYERLGYRDDPKYFVKFL